MSKNTFELPWYYRQVPRDFMSSPDVTMMTAEEIGAYFLLLQCAWLGGQDCTLPNDAERLAKLARVPNVSDIVLSKFQQDKEGRLYNPRLMEEWNQAVKRSKDAKKAISTRWENQIQANDRRTTTVLRAKNDSNTTKTKTQTKTKTKAKTVQGHAEAVGSASVEALSSAPLEPAQRLAQKLAAILGRENLKPETLVAWAQQAEAIITEYGEQVALDVVNFALVESADGFWRGRIYAMKNFVRCFKTMHEQMKRGAETRKAADPLTARAASLQTGHDFSAMAKGDL